MYNRLTIQVILCSWLLICGCGSSGLTPTIDDGSAVVGEERGHCYPDHTCNEGLICYSNYCVRLPTDDGGAILDGGPIADGGFPTDGGIIQDGGWQSDGGIDDAGIAPDAGMIDGGYDFDGGQEMDGGHEDGGTAFDGSDWDGGLETDGGEISADGGEREDGGQHLDSGIDPDGGPQFDGGSSIDGGPVVDGGAPVDGGSMTDGGVAQDGGPTADGGPAADGGPEFILIQSAGKSFSMGSPSVELGRQSDEVQHQVSFTYDYEIQPAEVTQGQFQSLMGYNPSFCISCGSNCPVEEVNWHEALSYLNQLSIQKGVESCFVCSGDGGEVQCGLKSKFSRIIDCPGYRLPTEAEWEYAVRAGTPQATYNGNITYSSGGTLDPVIDPIAWYVENAGAKTHPRKQKWPNTWGLYDILGNVSEWCWDWYAAYSGNVTDPVGLATGINKVIRGGSWNGGGQVTRAASRRQIAPNLRYYNLGFRPVRTR